MNKGSRMSLAGPLDLSSGEVKKLVDTIGWCSISIGGGGSALLT